MIDRRRVLQMLAFGGVGLSGATGWAAVEPHLGPTIVTWPMALPRWSPTAPSLRVALLADLHAVEPWTGVARLEAIVERTRALEADLILLLGDYLSSVSVGEPVPIETTARILGGLAAPLGVHGILGNHDYGGPSGRRGVLDAFAAAGIDMLTNDVRHVVGHGHDFHLSGTESVLVHRPDGRRWADLAGTLARLPDDGRPVVHMAHEPILFSRMPARVDLTLSGHTHGGQIRLPGLPPIGGERLMPGGWVRGPYEVDGRRLVVSSGLGTTFLPVRFGVPPEITLVQIGSSPVA